MGKKKKQKKGIKSLEKQIKLHKDKMKEENVSEHLREYWSKEIKSFKAKIADKQRRVKNG